MATTHAQDMAAAAAAYEELWTTVDYSQKDSVIRLFPAFMQEQYDLRKRNVKNVSRLVHIEPFNLKTPFGDQTLLKSTELHIEPTGRQCLYGPNSSGKTLLFSNISEGKIKDFPKHLHVHHCKELEPHELGQTVLDTVVNSHPFRNTLIRLEKKLTELLEAAKADPTKDEKYIDGLRENLDWAKFTFNSIRGDDAPDRAKKMLRVLGFDEAGQAKFVHELSGGLKMRVALCMAFFIEADLLLLDEPTNHLDFPSVLWLENRLRGYKSSFILVSHDRELLNNVTTVCILIEEQQLKYYTCGFKEFEKKKAAEDAKKFTEIEKFLEKNRNADPSTMLGRQKADKKEWSDNYYRKQIALAGKFTFPVSVPLENNELGADGKPVAADDISLIRMTDLRFSYKPEVENPVFIFNDPIGFNVTATTRVGVMGPNGAGKSTFLKLLTHKLTPTAGTVVHHPNFKLAYFGQHSTAELNLEQTALEFMMDQFPTENPGTLRNHLSKTGVAGPVAETRMQRLSFSQRSCVIFSKLTFHCPHLLILDEPTNFLDLESVDSLISACNKYKGALLLVSHNRDFLRKCAKHYLSVVPGHFELYDNLKAAERGTYTFIAEMEEGGRVGADALAKNPGGGTVHASQVNGGAAGSAADPNEPKSISIGSNAKPISAVPPPGTAAAKPAAGAAPAAATGPVTYKVGDHCEAMWTDGKWYTASVKHVAGPKITVTYIEYGNTTTLSAVALRPLSAAAAAKLATKKAPAGKAPAAAGKAAAAAPKKK